MTHKTVQTTFFLALLVGTLAVVFFLIQPFVRALILAFTLAIIFHPLYQYIRRIFKNHDSLASLATILIILVLVLLPLIFLSTQVFDEGRDFYFSLVKGNFSDSFLKDGLLSISNKLFGGNPEIQTRLAGFTENLDQYVKQGLLWLLEHIGVVFSSITRLLFNLFISLIALYYLFKNGSAFKKYIISISPLSDRFDEDIMGRLEATVSSVIKGVIVVAIVQAILAGTGFAIFSVPNPALWGTLAMIAALIPGIGTALVMIPAVLFLFFTGHVGAGIGLAIWGAGIVGMIDNFLSPSLMGRGVKIHPFLILLSVLGGLALFGPLGFLLGPLIFSFLFALLDIYPVLILHERHE